MPDFRTNETSDQRPFGISSCPISIDLDSQSIRVKRVIDETDISQSDVPDKLARGNTLDMQSILSLVPKVVELM